MGSMGPAAPISSVVADGAGTQLSTRACWITALDALSAGNVPLMSVVRGLSQSVRIANVGHPPLEQTLGVPASEVPRR